MKIDWFRLTELINANNKILLSTHINPDADGLGSEVAMYYHLKKMNKECKIINISNMMDKYEFLNKDNIIEQYNSEIHDSWIEKCNLAIIFDIGNHSRLGEISNLIKKNNVYCVSIDHHPSDGSYFDHQFLDVKSPATGFMVWQYFKCETIELSYDMAESLYAALITDTGSFRYNSTTSNCHIMAKELLDLGVKPYDVYASIYEQRSLAQIKLFGKAIESLKIVGEFGCINISLSMLEECGATLDDIDGFTDFIRSIQGVEVAFMISEIKEKNYRINFRSRGKYIINDIAEYFNGGGHKLAAGATVKGLSVEKIEGVILDKLKNKKEDLCQ
ncbi:MAG: hypothetical protein CMG66_01080 [Candidatus Marinimicrobia bacterium]|nr:hypothetical protein [Candidatus Neomarinimicrobiota bacterium]|tara:strand:+ start:15198 stop:16190 length:993 start_codon:yes stop_codon:yes gene_type:complete